ncbi:MAG: type II toxin-antitoxin system PemK/MazF family toxin, partial [Acidimicrobiia bacterium]
MTPRGATDVASLRRGDIWLADVPGDKRRPVVVLTRNSVLARLSTVLVAPVTSRVRDIPTEVALGPAHGLSR